MNTHATELPTWASDILAAVPARGGGLNRWLLRAAIALRRCGRSDQDIHATLTAVTSDQPIKHGEIERAVDRSVGYMSDGPSTQPRRRWCGEDVPLRQKIIRAADGAGAVELWERSPYRLLGDGPDSEELVDMLFPGNPLLCCAKSLPDARTAPREQWRGKLSKCQFIVPSAMSAETGLTQDGRTSARCLDNVGPRQYLVVEQDAGSFDDQAGVLLHLAEKAPMVLVLHSGGKSLHAWFRCRGASDEQLRAFFGYAVRLGADPATWTRCQLVRMPEGTRDNGARQGVLYFNREIL